MKSAHNKNSFFFYSFYLMQSNLSENQHLLVSAGGFSLLGLCTKSSFILIEGVEVFGFNR